MGNILPCYDNKCEEIKIVYKKLVIKNPIIIPARDLPLVRRKRKKLRKIDEEFIRKGKKLTFNNIIWVRTLETKPTNLGIGYIVLFPFSLIMKDDIVSWKCIGWYKNILYDLTDYVITHNMELIHKDVKYLSKTDSSLTKNTKYVRINEKQIKYD